jgi:hypothetical protein
MIATPVSTVPLLCPRCDQRFWLPPGRRLLPPHRLSADYPSRGDCPGILGQLLV